MSSFVNGNCDHRIAIIARLDQPGGVQSMVLSLIKGLNKEGFVPDVIWDSQPNPDLLNRKGVMASFAPVRQRIPSSYIVRVPETFRYLLRAVNTFSTAQLAHAYDFYYIFYNGFLIKDGTPHIRYLNGPPLLPQLDMAPSGLKGIPYKTFRWLYQHGFNQLFPAYEYHQGSPYVINSNFTAGLFAEAHGVHLPVVHPPIDLSGRSFHPEDLSTRDTVTFFSRFVDYKRPEMVLELARRYPNMRFVLMGGVRSQSKGLFDTLQQAIRQTGLNNTELIANPTDQLAKAVLARTLFYIFPAVNEHFGMATAEAIGSGAIPFVHDSGGQREIVPDPRLRFSDDQFIHKFSQLLKLTDQERNQIRMAFRTHVQAYSEDVFIQKMMRFMPRPHNKLMKSEVQNGVQAATD